MNKEKINLFSGKYHTPELAAYFSSLSSADEGYAAHVIAAMQAAGVRGAAVSALEGKLLETLARLSGAKKAVEIGSLYGYSPIGWPAACRRARASTPWSKPRPA